MILWDNSYVYATDPNKNVRVKRFPNDWMGSGWIEEFFDYKPFGELKNYVADPPRFMFSSKGYMPETGMYHYLYRAYSPSLARFITRDPIEEQGGVNLYCFVNNNPVSKWDVAGLEECCNSKPPSYRCCEQWEQAWHLAGHDSLQQCINDAIGSLWWSNSYFQLSSGIGLAIAGQIFPKLSSIYGSLVTQVAPVIGAFASIQLIKHYCSTYYCVKHSKANCKCIDAGIFFDTWECECKNGTTMIDDSDDIERLTKPEMKGAVERDYQL